MPEVRFSGGSMLVGSHYKPGDQAPTGYLDWHEWAEVQHKAGLRQEECGVCGKWRYPQQMSGAVKVFHLTDSRGHPKRITKPICNGCSRQDEQGKGESQ